VGRVPDPWRTADAGVRGCPVVDGLQIHGAGWDAAFAKLENIPLKPRAGDRNRDALVRRRSAEIGENRDRSRASASSRSVVERRAHAIVPRPTRIRRPMPEAPQCKISGLGEDANARSGDEAAAVGFAEFPV
jgi:hypothetical protein